MNTRISSKVAALALALLINGTVFGGVAFLFSAEACRGGRRHPGRRRKPLPQGVLLD